MAPANPNPTRISAPLWGLITKCTDLTATAFDAEHGGAWMRKPGSHADTEWLVKNYPNDYSLKGSKQKITTGPLSKFGRAWDWTFPSAQRGDWSEIGIYSNRVKKAWESGDPRMFGVFEVLCQTPEDRQPEGYVWYPEKKFRVPDSSHEWHMHIGILTQHINDQAAMDGLFDVLAGKEDDMDDSTASGFTAIANGTAHWGYVSSAVSGNEFPEWARSHIATYNIAAAEKRINEKIADLARRLDALAAALKPKE